jgi:NADH-quinone oxidoreductase subunit J
MNIDASPAVWIIGILLVLSSLLVILLKKPVHASLSFLFSLLCLAALYLELSAQFIAIMQILVYAGAILVIFMYVIVLFQDAYLKIEHVKPQSPRLLLSLAAIAFVLTLIALSTKLIGFPVKEGLPEGYGTVESLGKALYLDFFFPFEAVILIFLVALIGALYIGKKEGV